MLSDGNDWVSMVKYSNTNVEGRKNKYISGYDER